MEATTRIFITPADVMTIFGCKERTAQGIVKKVNDDAEEQGLFAFVKGKANKYIFAEKYGIPIEYVDQVISEGKTP